MKNVFRTDRFWPWFIAALIVRGAFFWIFLHEHGLHQSYWGWGSENGDTGSYFIPIDSFLDGQAYRPDYRMPGYGAIYGLFRMKTTPAGAGTAIIFLQLLLSAASVVLLMRSAKLLGASTVAQRTVFWAYALCARLAVYDVGWFTESFCTAAIIFGIYCWLMHVRHGSRWSVLWSGAWITWAVFLKPVQALWLMPLLTGILLLTTTAWRTRVIHALLFSVPFLVADGWWVQRNWRLHHTFVPLSNGYFLPWLENAHIFPVMRFSQATGGNCIWWDPGADIRWFNVREGPLGGQGPRKDEGVTMPTYAITERCTRDSLTTLATEMERWSDPRTTPQERLLLSRATRERCDRYIRYYQEDAPWQYHVMARGRLARNFFARAGLGSLFGKGIKEPVWWMTPIDLMERVWYWTVMPLGLFATFLFAFHWRRADRVVAFLAGAMLANIFVFPLVLRLCEGRYLVPMLPWLLVMAVLFTQRTKVFAKSRT